jgi:hypothetical protein
MIILDSSLKSLVIKLGGAKTTNELDWTVSYVENTSACNGLTNSLQSSTNGSNDGTTNGAAYVTMVAHPPVNNPSTIYDAEVVFISVKNTDTVPQTVTIALDDNGTYRVLFSATIAVGTNVTFNSSK